MKELFLFVRPPRALWLFNGPSSAFWPPLAFASLAAALRASVNDIEVAILDCPAVEMGWKTLAKELADRAPTYVAIGEEAVSAAEGFRLARMAKRLGSTVIAGGCTFGNLPSEVLSTGLVDVVVRGEGERTIVELVGALRQEKRADALALVNGIAFRRETELVITPPRPLIEDLDTLPMPAWDLLPMDAYGRRSRNHPSLATIEHGRGCVGSCNYCVLWRQMAEPSAQGPRPRYRSKSAARALEEVRLLTRRYSRRYLCWVDPCFNADASFLDAFTEGMAEDGLSLGQSAWVRPDFLLRDEQSGLLKRLVRCGLNEIYVGIERPDDDSLEALGRSDTNGAAGRVLPLLSRKYPSLYTVGSFIYGLPGDSWRTIKAMRDTTIDLRLDMAFYIPLTGLPGSAFWERANTDTLVERLSQMDFLTAPSGDTGRLRRLTRLLALSFLFDLRPRRLAYTLRTLTAKNARKRRMNRRLFARGALFALSGALAGFSKGPPSGMVVPSWYES